MGAIQLARQYFGQGENRLVLGKLGTVGNAQQRGLQKLGQGISEWSPSEHAIEQLAREASIYESSAVVADRYSKQLTRRNRALMQATRVIGNHQIQNARLSVESAKMQDHFLKQMIPLSLDMGATVASHEGRTRGLSGSRLNF